MIYMKSFIHADWLRACQLILNSVKTWNFLSAESWDWVQNLKLNWLTGKSRKRNSQMANQIFCFQIKRTPWMAQFFPNCLTRVVSSAQPSRNFFINHHGEFFSCILLTGSYGALRARAILLVFEQIYSCLFIPNCTRNHVITYTKRKRNQARSDWFSVT